MIERFNSSPGENREELDGLLVHGLARNDYVLFGANVEVTT